MIVRLNATLDDLHTALGGDDREAGHARDVIRSLIERVTLTPIELDRIGKCGQGPVRFTVEGSLASLIDLAGEVGVIQHPSHPGTTLDPATAQFTYYVDYIPEDGRIDAQTYADLVLVARLLDDTDRPLTRRAIVDTLVEADGYAPDGQPDYSANGSMMLRALNDTRYLRKTGEVRAIQCGPIRSGFVWNHIDRSDGDWKARAMAETIPSMHLPLPVIRIGGPDAFVVVIGPPREDVDDT